MNRKNFLSSMLGLGTLIPGMAHGSELAPRNGVDGGKDARRDGVSVGEDARRGSEAMMPDVLPAGSNGLASANVHVLPPRVPGWLVAGDTIGITCPAGFITLKEIQPAIQQIESWGFKVRVGATVGKRDFSFGGTDAERLADLQQMLDDATLKAILCARGGYGAVHIVDKLDLSGLSNYPKWVIGFSDITVLLCHIHRNLNMASIHSKMCNSFPDDWSKAEPVQIDSILSIRSALAGSGVVYPVPVHPGNRTGVAEGVLVGGNLKTLETLSGTRSDIDTVGKILFVEDTGEYLYSIDRMFWNLERTGKLAGLSGLVVGGFKVKPDDPGEEFGRSLYDIVLARVAAYSFPVCFDFPVGHQKNNFALLYGMTHRLEVGTTAVSLQQSDLLKG